MCMDSSEPQCLNSIDGALPVFMELRSGPLNTVWSFTVSILFWWRHDMYNCISVIWKRVLVHSYESSIFCIKWHFSIVNYMSFANASPDYSLYDYKLIKVKGPEQCSHLPYLFGTNLIWIRLKFKHNKWLPLVHPIVHSCQVGLRSMRHYSHEITDRLSRSH